VAGRAAEAPITPTRERAGVQYWNALSEGGEEGPCGRLKDRFGLSWQIIPTVLTELLA
jgi:predicted 3-demethylubiquinone-9 3-methyltransferase (glyoxalase superfamily)